MGTYLIPNAMSVQEAVDYSQLGRQIGEPPLTASWSLVEGGVLFTDDTKTDTQCASLYEGYVPSGLTDAAYERALPADLEQAKQVLMSFWSQNPSSITDAQSATLSRAMLVVLRYLIRRIA